MYFSCVLFLMIHVRPLEICVEDLVINVFLLLPQLIFIQQLGLLLSSNKQRILSKLNLFIQSYVLYSFLKLSNTFIHSVIERYTACLVVFSHFF